MKCMSKGKRVHFKHNLFSLVFNKSPMPSSSLDVNASATSLYTPFQTEYIRIDLSGKSVESGTTGQMSALPYYKQNISRLI